MNVWIAAAWGGGGGLIVELLEWYRALRRAGGMPWKKDPDHEPHPPALILAAVIRAGIGAVIAAAMAASGQISGALGGLTAGIAAPLVIDQLGQTGLQGAPDDAPPLPAAGGSDG